jgi:hypothetical protein
MPIIRPANSLLTSQNDELSGTRAALWDSEASESSGVGALTSLSSSVRRGGRRGGVGGGGGQDSGSGLSLNERGVASLRKVLGTSRLADLGIGDEDDNELDFSQLELGELQRMAGLEETPVMTTIETNRRAAEIRQRAGN